MRTSKIPAANIGMSWWERTNISKKHCIHVTETRCRLDHIYVCMPRLAPSLENVKYVDTSTGWYWDGDGLLQEILRPSNYKAECLSDLDGVW